MTNREKFIEVFGDNPQRHHITKSWWDEDYDEPQEGDRAISLKNCDTCLNNNEEWDSDSCDGCSKNHSNYDRAISLNAVLDIWHTQYCSNRQENDEEQYKRIVALPPVTPQQQWIPMSERMPEENEYIGDVCKYYLVQDEYGDMHVAHYKKTGWYPIHSIKSMSDEVVAWMPLPKPYVPQEREEGE